MLGQAGGIAAVVFETYHPSVPVLYMVMTLIFTMGFMHPVCIAFSLLGATGYVVCSCGLGVLVRDVLFQLPILVLIAIINPLFSSAGAHTICMLGPWRLSVEGLCYGVTAAGLLTSSLLWFRVASVIVPFDSALSLASRRAPLVALMVSMTVRLVPQFVRRGRQMTLVRKVNDPHTAALGTLRHAAGVSGALLAWGLEDSLERATSMRARGWGAARRTSYVQQPLRASDLRALLGLVLAAGICVYTTWYAFALWTWFPTLGRLAAWWWFVPYAVWMLVPCMAYVVQARRKI